MVEDKLVQFETLPDVPRVLNIDDVCTALGRISRSTFYNYVNDLGLKAFLIKGRTVVDIEDLKAFIKAQKEASAVKKAG